MTSYVLVIFGGGLDDEALASDFAGLSKLFLSDSKNMVTSLSTVELLHCCEDGILVFGEGSLTQQRQKIYDSNEPAFYSLVPEGTMKCAIFRWMSVDLAGSRAGDKINVVLCCHGEDEYVELGFDRFKEKLYCNELLPYIQNLNQGVVFNLINLACDSGSWVAKISSNPPSPTDDISMSLHASCEPEKFAYAMRSISGKDRCGVFSAAVVKSLRDRGSLFIHHQKVRDKCTHNENPHCPQMYVNPNSKWAAPSESIYTTSRWDETRGNSFWGTVTNSVASLFQKRRAPSYGIVKAACQNSKISTMRDSAIFNMARRYVAEESTALKTRLLGELMTLRRLAQLEAFFFLKEAEAQGLFDSFIFKIELNFDALGEAGAYNLEVLKKCFPIVEEYFDILTQPQITSCRFNAPERWIIILMTASMSFSGKPALPIKATELMNVGKKLGWKCNNVEVVEDMVFQCYPSNYFSEMKDTGRMNLFDRILPINYNEWLNMDVNWMSYQTALSL